MLLGDLKLENKSGASDNKLLDDTHPQEAPAFTGIHICICHYKRGSCPQMGDTKNLTICTCVLVLVFAYKNVLGRFEASGS